MTTTRTTRTVITLMVILSCSVSGVVGGCSTDFLYRDSEKQKWPPTLVS